MSSKYSTKYCLAFTLIELLVVVAIIAILISILVPSLGAARTRARVLKCQANLRSWGQANLMYAGENSGYMCYEGTLINDKPVWADSSSYYNALPPYMNVDPYYTQQNSFFPVGTPIVDLNGNNTSVFSQIRNNPPIGGMNSIFICPDTTTPQPATPADDVLDQSGQFFVVSGSYNSDPTQIPGVEPEWMEGLPKNRPQFLTYSWNAKLNDTFSARQKFTSLPQPEADMIMAEKAMRKDEPTTPTLVKFPFNDLWKVKVSVQRLSTRHYKGFNSLFGDGHVIGLTYEFANSLMYGKTFQLGTNNKPGQFVVDPWAPLGGGN